MIQRAIYLRDGQPRGVTFGGDLADTAEFVELWERVTGCVVLVVKPVRSGTDHARVPASLDQGWPWEGSAW